MPFRKIKVNAINNNSNCYDDININSEDFNDGFQKISECNENITSFCNMVKSVDKDALSILGLSIDYEFIRKISNELFQYIKEIFNQSQKLKSKINIEDEKSNDNLQSVELDEWVIAKNDNREEKYYSHGSLLITDYVDISAINKQIAGVVISNGLYSREAVVNVAKTTISLLDSYDYRIPYQSGGMYHREKKWGLNPQWGSTIYHNDKYVPAGLDCRNFVIWTFKQAGLSLIRGYGSEGIIDPSVENTYKNFEDGRPGDVIDHGRHIMLIIENDKKNECYVVAQSLGGYGVEIKTYKYEELQPQVVNGEEIFYKVYNMDGVYNDTGYWSCTDPKDLNTEIAKKAGYRPYAYSFHIPISEFPDYYELDKYIVQNIK